MRISLFLIPLPVLGLPGPKHERRSTPVSWWPPSSSLVVSPASPKDPHGSTTPQDWPTPHPSSQFPTLDTPRSSGLPTPSKSLPTRTSSRAFVSSQPPGSETLEKPASEVTSRSQTTKVPSTGEPSVSSLPIQPQFPGKSPASSPMTHASPKKGTGSQFSTTRDPQNESLASTSPRNHHSPSAMTTELQQTASSSFSASAGKPDSPQISSSSLAGAPNSTSTDKFHPPGVTHADPKPPTTPSETNSRSTSPGKGPGRTLSKTETSGGGNIPSATEGPTISASSQTTTSETTEVVDVITPEPSSVTVSKTETISGVEHNTIYKTEKDGHETSIPILFGSGCLIFCNSGALLLWGIGPGNGKFELPPLPKIGPLPKFIEIQGGVPTPVGTQGSDPEPTKEFSSQGEESSVTSGRSTSGGSTTETSTAQSSTTESSATESSATESTSSCTRATITNCDVTTSCGLKTCSTVTSCEPTVTDCTAAGTTVSTTTSEQYELTMAVYTGHSLTSSSPPTSSTETSESYQLTMAAYTGHGLTSQSSSTTPSSSLSYGLTMAVYTGHGSGSPSPSPSLTSGSYQLTMAVHTGHGSGSLYPSSAPNSLPYQLTMDVYTGHGSGSPSLSPTSGSRSYLLTMDVHTGHGSGPPSFSATPGNYELTIAEYTGHGSVIGSVSSNATSESYQLTMAEYTGHNLTSLTFRTYKITTTKEIGGETTQLCVPFVDNSGTAEGSCQCSSGQYTTTLPYFDATSDLCGYASFPNPEPTKAETTSSRTKELGLPSGKASCYPKPDDDNAYKLIETANPDVGKWCEDPDGYVKTSGFPLRLDFIEGGWALDGNAPEQCDELPTAESDSDAYWVCKIALETIARDCPWIGGTIDTPCGEFHLRGCIGPCPHV